MKKLELINLVIGLVVVVLLGVAGAYLKKLVSTESQDAIPLQAESNCDLAKQACVASQDGKSIKVDFSRPVTYLQKIAVAVQLQGYEKESVKKIIIDFSMRDMQMGINRFELKSQDATDNWQGMVILPVCVSGRVDWLVKLYVETDTGNYLGIYKLTLSS